MRIIIRPAMNRAGFSFWLYKDDGQRLWVAKPTELLFEERSRDGAWQLPEPTGFVRTEEYKELRESVVEEMASAGLIDPGTVETARELKATRYHLEDMRKLALKDVT